MKLSKDKKRDTYFSGKGLGIKLKEEELNNFYKPTSVYQPESLDYIHAVGPFTKKFVHIAIKEWFYLLKPKGYLVIDYKESKDINFKFIEELFWWLLKGNYNIISHEKRDQGMRIVVQKKNTMFVPGDSIDKWSFGIITNGERDDWLDEIIQSIKALKIPHYEIIACGKYRDRKEKDFTYINFNERSDRGWITKKKNLIAEKATYENLCIIHDRLVFDKDWYKGMKKYGNAFEVLGCVQIEKKTGVQAGDWLTVGGQIYTLYKFSRLEYSDWDYFAYLSGQLTIIKKSIWEKILWDETRYWYEWEDVDLCFRARDAGFIVRFNPYAVTLALAWTHGKLPLKYYFKDGILPKDMLFRRTMRIFARLSHIGSLLNKIELSKYNWFFKSRLYKRLIYH